ncbi:MAG TPA: lysylphosphatidylglycerol synthase domain-containing protein, partial [Terriglobales bacterium]|nr:lysylphosphatidylglycerol synthase domain-containing protein [Terriglobales bacterium]
MPDFQRLIRVLLRFLAALIGVALLGYLVFRTGPAVIWKQVQQVGWGLLVIMILGGIAQFIKTCAWRQTFTCDIGGLSWARSYGVQLVSDAAGQLGLPGKLIGEGLRVSLLGSAVPLPNGISAAAIDGGLHILTAAVVTVLGIIATLLLAHLGGRWRVDGLLIAALLVVTVLLAAVGVVKRFPLMGNAARVIGRLPILHNWVSARQPIIDSAEHNLLTFYRVAPAAFAKGLALNFLWHALAVLEVFL